MKTTSIDQIYVTAQNLQRTQKKWHFHILTPECQLNTTDQYALILENISDQEIWVCYSAEPYMDVGQKLVQLLHGDDVVMTDTQDVQKPPSPQVKELLQRAKQMSQQGRFWHHHMLFPGCMFNNHEEKYVIVFEDQANQKIIESLSDKEPKSDLQHIERLFYSQQKK